MSASGLKVCHRTVGVVAAIGVGYYSVLFPAAVLKYVNMIITSIADDFICCPGPSCHGFTANLSLRVFAGSLALKLVSEPFLKLARQHFSQAALSSKSPSLEDPNQNAQPYPLKDRINHAAAGLFCGALALTPLALIYQMYRTFPSI